MDLRNGVEGVQVLCAYTLGWIEARGGKSPHIASEIVRVTLRWPSALPRQAEGSQTHSGICVGGGDCYRGRRGESWTSCINLPMTT